MEFKKSVEMKMEDMIGKPCFACSQIIKDIRKARAVLLWDGGRYKQFHGACYAKTLITPSRAF